MLVYLLRHRTSKGGCWYIFRDVVQARGCVCVGVSVATSYKQGGMLVYI